ncbi:MAG: hypothetical protein LBG05_10725 [Treponema sp.]|nr:hypothetical protein [Treponema sp.]
MKDRENPRVMGRMVLMALVVLVPILLRGFSGCQSMGAGSGGSREITINLDLQKTGPEIAATFYGIFYEDINYAADGGLYPELVRNRSFEAKSPDPSPVIKTLFGWEANYRKLGGEGKVAAGTGTPLFDTNPTYVTVTVTSAPYAIANMGYSLKPDMPFMEGAVYNFYLYLRNQNYSGNIVCSLENRDGEMVSNTVTLTPEAVGWRKYGTYTFTSDYTGKGALVLRCEGTGQFDLDFVSLMPVDTWGYGESAWPYGGLRRDLVEVLADLKPGFLRFPGGCIVEGAYRHETAYNWKDTIGEPEKRRENSNLWGYMMSYGLGFHEYFQLAEELGAEPVPVLNAGILCQARNRGGNTEPDYRPGVPEFDQLIQDYLDLIEYANGNPATVWGAKRADNGHSAPFNLKMIGIGNENWGPNYWRNFKAIREAVLAAYPDIKVITTTGPLASGPINNEAWLHINASYRDAIVDEHYYMEPAWFLTNTTRYDSYPRSGVEIFVGEYAAHETNRANTWNAALSEAAYITGLERNADLVKMSSYAPLFARQGMPQWAPDLIWFDGAGITSLTPSYHIQKLFSNNTGKEVLSPEKAPAKKDMFHASSVDREKGLVYTKLVNPYEKELTVTLNYANCSVQGEAELTTLSGDPSAREVHIEEGIVSVGDNMITLNLAPCSTVVLRIKITL